jgi:ubiquitin carboxyl-terminal hydrolase 5/13
MDASATESPKFQEGVRPAQFKALIGKGHEEFSTMRQQDSEEFLQHLLDRLRAEAKRQGRSIEGEPTEMLRFAMEQRLQCKGCNRVGYKEEVVDLASLPVEAVDKGKDADDKQIWERQTLVKSLETLTGEEELEGYACGHCGVKTTAVK